MACRLLFIPLISAFLLSSPSENVVVLAHATGRTLVLPPKDSLNHLTGSHSFDDFFDLEAINAHQEGISIITMEEFLLKEAVPGRLRGLNCTASDCASLPPRGEVDWTGQNPAELYSYLESVGNVPHWNRDPATCALVIPRGKDDVAVGGTPAYQSHHEQLCTYNSTEKLLHLNKRILSPFYSFLVFEDARQDLFAKRFIRNFLRYKDEVMCAAARVVSAVREHAAEIGVSPDFYSMHIRRGDFSIQYPERVVSAADLLKQSESFLPERSLVYIATDERDKSYFQPFTEKYNVLFLDDFSPQTEGINATYFGMIDQLVASKGKVFFGTWPSTFSSYINRLRGYNSAKEGIVSDGAIDSMYFSPDHMYDMMHYKSVDAPSSAWMREYPAAWYQIDEE